MPEVDIDYFRNQPTEVTSSPLQPEEVKSPTQYPVAQLDEQDVVDVVPSFKGVDLTKVMSRVELVAALTGTIPLNDFNLPKYIYRPDLLDPGFISSSAKGRLSDAVDILTVAMVSLEYHHGFPTIGNTGTPFWGALECETKEAHQAFLLYLEQPGARTFHHMVGYAGDVLTEWFHLHYWAFRARAYDMFQSAHHARMREQRILSVEGKHFAAADKLFGQITKALESISEEDFAKIDADKLVSMMEKVTKMHRVSVGLPANGDFDPKKRPDNLSVEVTMKQLAEKDGTVSKHHEDVDTIGLLSDPEALSAAQDLIVRVNRS
jgi:hypothetical protein